MRGLVIGILVLAMVTMLGACGGGGIPSSSLTIRNSATDALISASNAQGTITLNVGQSLQVRIMHTHSDAGNTQTDDVTQFAIYKWDSGSGATVDALGNITGINPGISILRVKYAPDWGGSSDSCRLTVVVN